MNFELNKYQIIISGTCILLVEILLQKAFANQPNQKDLEKLLQTNKCISCDLTHANLAYANLDKSNLNSSKLEKATLINSTLTNADLSHTNLSDANLYGSDLQGVDFTGARLYRTDLTNANLLGSNISRQQLISSNWYQAKGLNIEILHNSDILVLAKRKIRTNELKSAEKLVSFILARESEKTNLLVLNATIQLRIGDFNSAIHNLKKAKEQFGRDGDADSASIIDNVLRIYYSEKKKGSRKHREAGYGIEFINAIKGILPHLTQISNKVLVPLPIF